MYECRAPRRDVMFNKLVNHIRSLPPPLNSLSIVCPLKLSSVADMSFSSDQNGIFVRYWQGVPYMLN